MWQRVDCALQNTHIKQLMRTTRHQRVTKPVRVHLVTCDMYNTKHKISLESGVQMSQTLIPHKEKYPCLPPTPKSFPISVHSSTDT
jgi:hypothetical protein